MKRLPISTALHSSLQWSQPEAIHQYFELRSGSELAGTLACHGFLGSEAVGTLGGASWNLRRSGLLRHRIDVTDTASGLSVGAFEEPGAGLSGTITLADGTRLVGRVNFLLTKFSVLRQDAELELLRYDRVRGIVHLSADVLIRSPEDLEPHTWLLLLGWYFMVVRQGDTA